MDMSWSQWQDVISPKAHGAYNLHSVLQQKKQSLDFFFVASSIISVLEATGQANYLAANAVNEVFCRDRHSLGLPASVLNICPIVDVGFVAENEQAAKSLQAQGLHAAGEREFLECLELSLLQSLVPVPTLGPNGLPSPTCLAVPNQLVMGIHPYQDLEDPKCRVMWRRDRRMGAYHNSAAPSASAANCTQNEDELREVIATLSAADAKSQLQNPVTIEKLAREIGKKINEYLLRPDTAVQVESS
jgi:hypothetical protein